MWVSSFHPRTNKGIVAIENRLNAVDIWKKGAFDMPPMIFGLVCQERYLYSGDIETFLNGESTGLSGDTLD